MLIEKVQIRDPSAPPNFPTPMYEKWWGLQPNGHCDIAFTAPPEFVYIITGAKVANTNS